jgi:sugar/nucleoside kinase (ribokinase family)
MRKEPDRPFDQAADLTGPYPSGDVAIFIDAAARMGADCAIIGSVGGDDFGKCLLGRLEADGVDVSMVRVLPDETTGVAFVAYFGDGSRKFIYHWSKSAAGNLSLDGLDSRSLDTVKWMHITGCNIAVNERCRDTIYALLERLPATAKISFDPNIRPEVLSVEQIRALCAPVMERCSVFFPSKGEAMLFTQADSDDAGCRMLAAEGKLVVLKNGADGCLIYTGADVIRIPAFPAEEVDPTGAGDSFCGGFLTALCDGMELYDAGVFANAVGALAVTEKGPMGGAPDRQTVLDFIARHKK